MPALLVISAISAMATFGGDPAGACCFKGDACIATCLELAQAECEDMGGRYLGDEVACAAGLCTVACGACCLPDEGCTILVPGDCQYLGGSYAGNGTTCATTPCGCAGDLNDDGLVGVADLVSLILAWGPCRAGCAEDLNGDLVVDVLDLVALITAWGPC